VLVALGLGNPGDQYERTRHNVGKKVVGSLIEKMRLRTSPGHGDYSFAEVPSSNLVLVVPTTYVNTSGRAAAQVLEHFSASSEDLLVVCDDFSLPLGTIRLRKQGSDGGHNGLASIIYELGSEAFGRLRMGTGPLPEACDAADFVLSRFEPEEEVAVERLRAVACEAVLAVAAEGMDKAMNIYNQRGDEKPGDHHPTLSQGERNSDGEV
jgi:PTH1 family peptidyl-tRNA hydrolase